MFTAPHFYLTMEINMDNAMAARAQMNEISPVKISFQDMTIKAAAMALRQHPAVNSSWMGDFIRTYQHIHIGSAMRFLKAIISVMPCRSKSLSRSLPCETFTQGQDKDTAE
jgi:pyruvate dehydrogenase E2 component (dihydrolipoamide acetyltransferase)